jgi:hypothetical protein
LTRWQSCLYRWDRWQQPLQERQEMASAESACNNMSTQP